jgi:hypothetical protein
MANFWVVFFIILIVAGAGFWYFDAYDFDVILEVFGFHPVFSEIVTSANWVPGIELEKEVKLKGCPVMHCDGMLISEPYTVPLKTVSMALLPRFLGGTPELSLTIHQFEGSGDIMVVAVGQPEVDPMTFRAADVAVWGRDEKITNLEVKNGIPIEFLFKSLNQTTKRIIMIVTFYLTVTNSENQKTASWRRFAILFDN